MSNNNTFTLREEILSLNKTINNVLNLEPNIDIAIKTLHKCLKSGKKILICGNGGSAAESDHLAAEFLIRLKPKNNRSAIPVISLCQNSSVLTACGNDLGFENIFSRTLEALGEKGDTLIVLSTSGQSKNILKVLKTAKKKKIKSISFLGKKGGKALFLSNINLIIPSNDVARIQECHLFLGHYIFSQVEKKLFNF
jgi:D-sedoheptulose 7-phosphate isomerase